MFNGDFPVSDQKSDDHDLHNNNISFHSHKKKIVLFFNNILQIKKF